MVAKKKNVSPQEKREPKPRAGKKAKLEAEPKASPAKPRTRKRPASNPPPPAVEAAPHQPETSVLEQKRLEVAEELRKVEHQIYDLETKYLDSSSAYGNAVRGYEGFLGGVGVANRKVVIKPEERLFSSSSATGQVHASL